jgi:hypothetical protein
VERLGIDIDTEPVYRLGLIPSRTREERMGDRTVAAEPPYPNAKSAIKRSIRAARAESADRSDD